MIVLFILWLAGLLFIFIAQYYAVKKADREWHINAATFKRLRKRINKENA